LKFKRSVVETARKGPWAVGISVTDSEAAPIVPPSCRGVPALSGVSRPLQRASRKGGLLAARGRSRDSRVAGARVTGNGGRDARRCDAGDAGASSRSSNTADHPMPPATQRATRGCGTPASLLVVHDDTASIPPRVLHRYLKTLSRDYLDFYHGLLKFFSVILRATVRCRSVFW
jgi:hypothetical protein